VGLNKPKTKLVIFQLLKQILSPAKWVREVRSDLILQTMIGHITPSRTALYSFRNRVGTVIDLINQHLIKESIEHKILSPTVGVMDGTSIRSYGSRHRIVNQKTLTRRRNELADVIRRENDPKSLLIIAICVSSSSTTLKKHNHTCPAGHAMPYKTCEKKRRTIVRPIGQELVEQQKAKMTEECATKSRKLRAQTIERTNADIKHRIGLRRFGSVTLERARNNLALANFVVNLMTIRRLLIEASKSAAATT